MSVKVRFKNGRAYLDIYVNGTRHWEKLDIYLTGNPKIDKEVKAIAEAAAQKRALQIFEHGNDFLDQTAANMPVIQYAEQVIKTKQDGNKNPLPKSMKYLKQFAGEIALKQVTPSFVERYKEFLLIQPNLGKNTAQKYLEAMKSLLRRAVMERILPNDPSASVRNIRVPQPVTYSLTVAEIERLAQTPIGGELGGEVRKMFFFGLYSGLRISDLRQLRWKQIQRDPLSLTVRQQKTGEPVAMPLHEAAFAIINDKRLHNGDEYVFPHAARTKTNLNQYLISWSGKAGVEKPLGFHVARRTFGTLILQGGSDLVTVAKLLGHTNLRHTARYLKTDSERVRAAVESLPTIDIQLQKADVLQIRK